MTLDITFQDFYLVQFPTANRKCKAKKKYNTYGEKIERTHNPPK